MPKVYQCVNCGRELETLDWMEMAKHVFGECEEALAAIQTGNARVRETEMTIDKRDIVSFWIYRTMKRLEDSDDGHKYMVYRLLELIDVNKYKNKEATMAGAIMSLAFDTSPTKHHYKTNSKAWAIMYAMDHKAIYDQIRRVQRKLAKQYAGQIAQIAEEYRPDNA